MLCNDSAGRRAAASSLLMTTSADISGSTCSKKFIQFRNEFLPAESIEYCWLRMNSSALQPGTGWAKQKLTLIISLTGCGLQMDKANKLIAIGPCFAASLAGFL